MTSVPPIELPGLADWAVRLSPLPPLPEGDWTWTDGEGHHARRLPGNEERIHLRADPLGEALVALGPRTLLLDVDPADQAVARAWATDQIAPRIHAHRGDLVVHAGACADPEGRAVLIVGPSGQGKSTLSAFLHRAGWGLLGDDAMILRPGPGGAGVRSLYPRLRLRRDSWTRFFPDMAAEPPPGWQAAIEVRDPLPGDREHRLGAILCLAGPGSAPAARLDAFGPAAACLELVRNAYALDPADRAAPRPAWSWPDRSPPTSPPSGSPTRGTTTTSRASAT